MPAVLFLASLGTPASAARPSPRPTATIVGAGTATTERGEEIYLDVDVRDVDGVITEIEIRWGDNSADFALSHPCFLPPLPAPGDTHRFRVFHQYAEAGTYTARYVVHSTTG